jgi:methionyl-tRNA formyltransferase
LLKVLFMGTPDFAAESLRAILAAGHTVVGVVTQPDKPVGRGGKVRFSPVKEEALKHHLPVFQPKRVRRPEVIAELKALQPDVSVVVAFGQILSLEALQISPLGSFNIHGSLLPRWRGAAPIHRAIMAGDTETGITTMYMDEGMDTGDMCLVSRTPITPEDTGGSLHDRLAAMGAELIVETLRQLEAGTAPRTPQPAEGVTMAAKLSRQDEAIDWSRSSKEVYDQIRALNPWPGAFCEAPKGALKIWEADLVEDAVNEGTEPGTVLAVIKKFGVLVSTGDGALLVRTVQPPGKGRMDAISYVNGGGLAPGDLLRRPVIEG